ncbi:MAG: hypothetical protein LPJ93_08365 [Rhodobacterales bacterium]|nr:hypothetical protein [Rhodobacterales bacterium]
MMLSRHLMLIAGAGLAIYAATRGPGPRLGRRMGHRMATPPPMGPDPVRPAGPQEMRDRPASWDMVDERADESFPASDPPGTY